LRIPGPPGKRSRVNPAETRNGLAEKTERESQPIKKCPAHQAKMYRAKTFKRKEHFIMTSQDVKNQPIKRAEPELTRREQWYGRRAINAQVRKLSERFESSDAVRIPVLVSILWQVDCLLACPGSKPFLFSTKSAVELDEFIRNNESLYFCTFDDVIELLITSPNFAKGMGRKEKQKSAIEFLKDSLDMVDPQPNTVATIPIISTGVDVLGRILAKIEPIDWTLYCKDEKPPSEREYILRTIDRILKTATDVQTLIVNKQGQIYCFTGTHYRAILESELQNFLIESSLRCTIPHDIAIYQFFVEKMTRQFFINAGRQNTASEPDVVFINLRNGTLFFDKTGHRFERHTPEHFIRYVLDFDYDSKATAPRWRQHLDRSLPHPDKQTYLAKCLALPFYKGKIEKAPILFGKRDTGISTTLDVYKALIGIENLSSESLAALTQVDYLGDYARARLDGKLVNIASDISTKISDEGLVKTLISREMVSARRPHKEGFNMGGYARLVFAMNELPSQLFTDAALTKRVAIIEFDRQVASQAKDINFAEKIIATELPGVLNWIIDGLQRLHSTGRLDPPQCCIASMDQIRKDNDPLAEWLEERQYYVGTENFVTVKDAYKNFAEYCTENGNRMPAKKTFTRRLRGTGYTIDRLNHRTDHLLWFSTSPQEEAPEVLPGDFSAEERALSGLETGFSDKAPDKAPDQAHLSSP
jgi:putative DNA primase/helicase